MVDVQKIQFKKIKREIKKAIEAGSKIEPCVYVYWVENDKITQEIKKPLKLDSRLQNSSDIEKGLQQQPPSFVVLVTHCWIDVDKNNNVNIIRKADEEYNMEGWNIFCESINKSDKYSYLAILRDGKIIRENEATKDNGIGSQAILWLSKQDGGS